MQGNFYVLRLAGGTALIGFKGVTKAAVLVLVGTESGQNRLFAAVVKQAGEQVTLDEAGVTPDEILGVLEALISFHRGFLSHTLFCFRRLVHCNNWLSFHL